MTELRKYHGSADLSRGAWIVPNKGLFSGEIIPGKIQVEPILEAVSATDDRDIQPLVEAARELLAAADAFARGESRIARSRRAKERLEAALQPFNETGEES